jgi:methylenetetrahydrofolate dehydrogenase (NADP+)/methenyltetrahydrofolate cyclohydrolase
MDPHKDVDGLTPLNLGLVASGRESEAIPAATPQACIELAETQGSLVGKKVGVVGRGRTVGRPLASMLINRHATVTVCHTRTRDLREALAHCDVVMVAAGKPGLIRAEHLSTGQIVIDAGINVVTDGLVGDVDAESVRPIAAALTPVPGGVGTLTTAIVFRNLMRAMRLQGVV